MANTLITDDVIVNRMLAKMKNNMVLYAKCDKQFSPDFTNKVGETIKIRKRVRFVANNGADITSQIQDIVQGSVTVTLDNRKNVAFQLSSKERTLDLQEFDKTLLDPAVEELTQVVESAIAAQYYKIFWFLGTPGTGPSTLLHVGGIKTLLTKAGVPQNAPVSAFFGPDEGLAIADALKAVFPESIAKTAIEEAYIKRLGRLTLYECASLVNHTVGAHGGTPLVNGASQNVTYAASKDGYTQTLVTDGWTNSTTGILKAGDVFTIAGVNAINQGTRQSTGELQTFTVLADADSGASTGPATLTISPAIITSGAYQTVDAAPADNAVITVKTGTAGSQYLQNIAFHENAITVAFANLAMPDGGGATGSHKRLDNISVRMLQSYDILTDQDITRFDILFTVEVQNPFMAVRRTS